MFIKLNWQLKITTLQKWPQSSIFHKDLFIKDLSYEQDFASKSNNQITDTMKQQKYFQVLNRELVLQENSFSLRLLSTFMINCKPSKLEEKKQPNKKTH